MNDQPSPLSAEDPPANPVLENLVEEFALLVEQGTAPSVEEFAARHADHAEILRRILPAAMAMARLGSSDGMGNNAEAVSSVARESTSFHEARELGDFRLLREVGRGGMGIVYEAEQLSLGRRVAVKVLPFATMLDPRQLQRFRNEARAAATLDHPHIVSVYSVGLERGVHFFAMRFVEGRTLAEVIAELRGGARARDAVPKPTGTTVNLARASTAAPRDGDYFRQVAAWGIQAAKALEHAHQLGIVHRDIKPSNLLVGGEGHLWVTDFGLAMTGADSELTMTGDVLGTARYMSPEQARGDRTILDQRTDIYSLGVTLYEALTLQPAFAATDRHALLQHVVTDEPPPIGAIRPNVPFDLATIVGKAMQKSPGDRYSTAQELVDDLQRFLEQQPIRARRIGRRERLVRWLRRRQGTVIATCCVATLAAVGFAISVMLLSAERERTRERERSIEVQRAVSAQWQSKIQSNDYTSRISLAERAWKRSDFKQLELHLAECLPSATQPDLRGFEWHYLKRISETANNVWNRHEGAAFCARFSPDGRWIATAGVDGVRVWEWLSGKQVVWLTKHVDDVNSLAFSPDGEWLATAGDDHTVKIWATSTWQMQATLPHNGAVRAVVFSTDGHRLASAEQHTPPNPDDLTPGENVIRLWEAGSWRISAELRGHTDVVPSISFRRDGRQLASAGDTTARVWDVASGEQSRTLPHPCVVKGVLFCDARPGKYGTRSQPPSLITTAVDNRIRLWDVETGTSIASVESFGPADTIAYLADSDTLVAATRRGAVEFWRLNDLGATSKPFDVRRAEGQFWGVEAAPDGGSVITTRQDGAIQRWEIASPQDRLHLTAEVPFKDAPSFEFIEGEHMAVMAGGPLTMIDTRTGERRLCAGGSSDRFRAIAISSAFRRAAVGDYAGRMRIFDYATWQLLDEVDFGSGRIEFVRYAPDGKTLIVGFYGLPIVRDSSDGANIPWNWGDWKFIRSCAFSPAGDAIAVLAARPGEEFSDSSDLVVFDWPSGQRRRTCGGRYYAVAFSGDGALLAGATDTGSIHFWRMPTGEEYPSIIIAHPPVTNLTFAPDGRTIAGLAPTGNVTLWNIDSGRELVSLDTYDIRVVCLRFSPDGRSLAASGFRPSTVQKPQFLLWRGQGADKRDSTGGIAERAGSTGP